MRTLYNNTNTHRKKCGTQNETLQFIEMKVFVTKNVSSMAWHFRGECALTLPKHVMNSISHNRWHVMQKHRIFKRSLLLFAKFSHIRTNLWMALIKSLSHLEMSINGALLFHVYYNHSTAYKKNCILMREFYSSYKLLVWNWSMDEHIFFLSSFDLVEKYNIRQITWTQMTIGNDLLFLFSFLFTKKPALLQAHFIQIPSSNFH